MISPPRTRVEWNIIAILTWCFSDHMDICTRPQQDSLVIYLEEYLYLLTSEGWQANQTRCPPSFSRKQGTCCTEITSSLMRVELWYGYKRCTAHNWILKENVFFDWCRLKRLFKVVIMISWSTHFARNRTPALSGSSSDNFLMRCSSPFYRP